MYPGRHVFDHPDRPAVVMHPSGITVTYAELDARANRLAALFRSDGLVPGDHIALLMENHLEMIVAMSAAERSGLFYTPVNSFLSAAEAAYIIDDSRSRLVITTTTKAEAARELPGLCPRVSRWLMVDAEPGSPALTGPFESYSHAVAGYPTTPGENERLGTPMFYSSGTTGRPKAIKRLLPDAHPGEILAIEDFGRKLFHLREGMRFLSPAPLYHSGPQSTVAISLRLGATVVVMERFDAEQYLDLVEKHHITHSMVVPTMFSRMLKLPAEKRNQDLSSLEVVVHGAAPCPVAVKEAMIDWWGPVIYEYYGGTEANGMCGATPEEWLAHKGTVGRPFMGEPVILDDDGNECPPGVAGNIWFRGEGSGFEYFNDPGKTADAKDDTGTMSKIGDIGYLDEDGFLYLTDRQAFVIISGGVNIYPQEIENLLVTHPKVLDAAVFGVPDEDFGEAVKAVIQAADPAATDPSLAAELDEFCRAHLAKFKCPKSFDFIDDMPRLPTGKLYKKSLRDAYWAGADTAAARASV
ncbi:MULTISPECIES: AMP-binding protein [unclassified Rhodococcus (in: high G+C Gram-positive bacteria)]|uniref:AMP-binding protein n=1 Tax=unclassified Rhodococcus (in: high G+C Gram-positive bacteria) TaxID=192944 RepID=UPI001639E59D|nr:MULTISPECIES: AMP-binding protein [unclassified Rhodococcus (in: high G+C Gram-positive bacteria)]MBC2637682.1 AMP-binding protein [Rhodococcus sp. 3A]MBC2897574.1 AMP-binding protein [Rhodococcus sp. 4CII]